MKDQKRDSGPTIRFINHLEYMPETKDDAIDSKQDFQNYPDLMLSFSFSTCTYTL